MSYRDDDLEDQPDNPQDHFHNDYQPNRRPSKPWSDNPRDPNYKSDNPQSYFEDER